MENATTPSSFGELQLVESAQVQLSDEMVHDSEYRSLFVAVDLWRLGVSEQYIVPR